MARLTARVRTIRGTTIHNVIYESGVVPCEPPVTLAIVEEGGAFSLFRLDSTGRCVADTWHSTQADAMAQAEFEYGVALHEWVSDPSESNG
ncbi:MAG: hypothetical protein KDC95_16705 [Planctomycetes bacterium]|nr:hypothetical protein [Planctomycetota bacterium]